MATNDEVEVNVNEVNRDNLIKITANAVMKVQHKAINGRFKDDKKENIRIQYWKTLNSLIKTLSSLINDKELDSLHDEIESLKLASMSTDTIKNGSVEDIENNINTIFEIDERIKELQKKQE